MGAGKRRQIRKKIEDLIKNQIVIFAHYGYDDATMHKLAGDIMRLFPKPEVTVIHRKETSHFKIPFYKCGKCGGFFENEEWSKYYTFCPKCGRRISAVEDDTLWE